MLKLALGTLVTLSLFATSFGQYNTPQSSVWAVGNKKGMDFTTNPPSIIETGLMSANEGSATIADENGQLLFCTNGTNVWNREGNLMPIGSTINGSGANTASTTQAAAIIPYPSNPGKYFLFSLTQVPNSRLFSNIVDMNLNGGLGDIDTSYQLHKTLLKNGLTEKMTVAKGCNNDAWLLVHSNTSVSFLAYHITATGLDTVPVISQVGNLPAASYNQGVMKVAPDGTKILTTTFTGATAIKGLEIYDFDPSTGIVSNALLVDEVNAYGGTFSPKGSKIYVQEITTPGKVWQYDLANIGQATAKTFIGNSGQYCDMKLAPDGKIYVASHIQSMGFNSYRYFARINNPEALGEDCDFQDTVSVLAFPSGNNGSLTQGLPNDIIVPTPSAITSSLVMDSLFCSDEQFEVELNLPTNALNISWNDGFEGSDRTVNSAGIYIVNYQNGCTSFTDTFKIVQASILAPSIIQTNNSLALDASFAEIEWYLDGNLIATEQTIQITSAGVYSAIVRNEEGCEVTSLNTVQSSLSIIKHDANEVFIYPNPIVQNNIKVHAPGACFLSIFNNQGQIMLQLELFQEDQLINIESLAEGTYIVAIEWNDGSSIMKKIVKQ